jgi:putative endonuclease
MKRYRFYVYILTNKNKRVLYTGVTNDLERRLTEHYFNSNASFTGKYNCHFLLYFEEYQYINDAIAREKQIKGWIRKKKVELINSENPNWNFLNEKIMRWPPKDSSTREKRASE